MSFDEYRDTEFMKIKGLGYMFQYGFEKGFDYDEDSKEYIAKETDLPDALRVVFITMCYEDIISFPERRILQSAVSWQNPDEDVLRQDVINPFFKLNTTKYLGIKDVKGLVNYLNHFTVPDLIKENVDGIFHALDDGFIVNHHLIYYSDESKELWPEEGNRYSCLYKLDLGAKPTLEGYRAKEMIYKTYVRHHMAGKELVETLSSDVFIPRGHSKLCDWAYYDVEEYIDEYTLVGVNVMTGRKVKYKGVPVISCDNKIILLKDNVIYAIDGNEIKQVKKLDKYEYIDKESSFYYCGEKQLLIAPVIRGKFLPYKIDLKGDTVGFDVMPDNYIWYSIISLEMAVIGNKKISYNDFCHDGFGWFRDEDKDLKIGSCTVNNILRFVENKSLSDSKLAKSMRPIVKLVMLIGTVIDKNTDIADLLLSIRNDYINSEKGYWDGLIETRYGKNSYKYRGEERIERDMLAEPFHEDGVIGYKHRRFISEEYVNKVAEMYAQGKMKDYIGRIWFKDMCIGEEAGDPWNMSIYERYLNSKSGD